MKIKILLVIGITSLLLTGCGSSLMGGSFSQDILSKLHQVFSKGVKVEDCKVNIEKLENLDITRDNLDSLASEEGIDDAISELLSAYEVRDEKDTSIKKGDYIILSPVNIDVSSGFLESYDFYDSEEISFYVGKEHLEYSDIVIGHVKDDYIYIKGNDGDIKEGNIDNYDYYMQISEVYDVYIPTLTDTFIKDNLQEAYPGVTNERELRNAIKEELYAANDDLYANNIYYSILSILVDSADYIYITNEYKEECEDIVKMQYEALWRANNYDSYNDYIEAQDISIKEERDELIKSRLVEEALFKIYKISDENLTEYNSYITNDLGIKEDELDSYFTENELRYLRIHYKTMEFINNYVNHNILTASHVGDAVS